MNTQSTQRFVSDFAPLRSTALCASACRCAPQRNDLLVTTSPCRNSTLLDLPHRFATSLNATQQFVSYNSTQRGYPPCFAPLRHAPPRNSTQRFVSNVAPQLRTSLRAASLRNALQLNDLLITKLRSATIRSASPCNSTQRFVSDTAPLLSAAYRFASLRTSPQLNVIA